jgi:hypothetical protein
MVVYELELDGVAARATALPGRLLQRPQQAITSWKGAVQLTDNSDPLLLL